MPTATASTGNSATAATWTITNPTGPARLPTAQDDVVIPTGTTLTLTGDLLCQSLTMNATTTDTTLITATGTYAIIVGNGTLGVITMNANGTAGKCKITATGSGNLTIQADYIIANTLAAGCICYGASVAGSATLSLNCDIQTSGLGVCNFGTVAGTINFNQAQLRAANLNSAFNAVPFFVSTCSVNVQQVAASEPAVAKLFLTSTASLTSAAKATVTITPYGQDLTFVSATPATSNAGIASSQNYRSTGVSAGGG